MFNISLCNLEKGINRYRVTCGKKTDYEIRNKYGRLTTSMATIDIAAIDWLPCFNTTDKIVLKCLVAHQGKNADTFVSIQYMSIETELNRRTIERSIKRLEELELVTSYKRDSSRRIYRRVDVAALRKVFAEATQMPAEKKAAHPQSQNSQITSVSYVGNGLGVAGRAPSSETHFSSYCNVQCASPVTHETALSDVTSVAHCVTNVEQKSVTSVASRTRNDRYNNINNNNLNQTVGINQTVLNQSENNSSRIITSPPLPPLKEEEEADSHSSFAKKTPNATMPPAPRQLSGARKGLVAPPPASAREVYEYAHGQGFLGMTEAQACNWYNSKRKENWTFRGNPITDWQSMLVSFCRGCLKLKEYAMSDDGCDEQGREEYENDMMEAMGLPSVTQKTTRVPYAGYIPWLHIAPPSRMAEEARA